MRAEYRVRAAKRTAEIVENNGACVERRAREAETGFKFLTRCSKTSTHVPLRCSGVARPATPLIIEVLTIRCSVSAIRYFVHVVMLTLNTNWSQTFVINMSKTNTETLTKTFKEKKHDNFLQNAEKIKLKRMIYEATIRRPIPFYRVRLPLCAVHATAIPPLCPSMRSRTSWRK